MNLQCILPNINNHFPTILSALHHIWEIMLMEVLPELEYCVMTFQRNIKDKSH